MAEAKKKSSGAKKASGTRKYGPKSGEKVERAMHEKKAGTLRSGKSGKKERLKSARVP